MKSLAKQTLSLRRLLALKPSLKTLSFQGKPIVFYSTGLGLFTLCLSRLLSNFDKVSQNHGINRLRRIGYDDDLIWSANHEVKDISFEGAAITKLEKNFQIIRKEVTEVIQKRIKFPDSDQLTNKSGLWSWLSFFNIDGSDNYLVQSQCPETTSLIKSLGPNLKFGFCFISVLEPNTSIAAHRGSTSLRYRYHLCIDTEETADSGIRIGQKWIKWQVGKAFGFNDALEHEVVYNGKKPRTVLIIDLWPEVFEWELLDAISTSPSLLQLGNLDPKNTKVAIND